MSSLGGFMTAYCIQQDEIFIEVLREKNQRLQKALMNGASSKRLLRLWSQFIRMRDNYSCVVCDQTDNVAAHHICRKTFLPRAQFETGNGISLCGSCHRYVHQGFNGRPDLNLPMDSQGGEKIDTMSWLYGELEDNARKRGILSDEFYYLSDSTLLVFKRFQTYHEDTYFAGCRLEQANSIWRNSPLTLINAVLEANVLPTQKDPFPSDIAVFFD